MDTSNWRPTPPNGEPTMDSGDWRSQLPPESRQRIVNKIMETLKRRLPFSGHEGLNELKKIAVRFEEKIFTAASSQQDYLRRISLKMLTLENNVSTNPPDPGSKVMQQQVHNQAHSLPIQLQSNQNQTSQQLLSQNIQNNLTTTAVQSSSGLSSTLPSVPGINQNSLPSGGGGLNTSMQNMPGVSQNMVGGQIGQGMQANMFANQQRQMQGRPQVLPQQHQQQHQQQQQPQNLMYQQQLLRQKLQQGNLQHSLMQSQMQPQQQQQQQQQQSLLQPTQLHSAQQQGMQSSSVQPPSMQSSLPGITQNQQSSVQQSTQSMLQQHPQSVVRQQAQPQQSAGVLQPQATITQQSLMSQQKQPPLSQQQQQQLMNQQPNVSNLQQNQLIGQQNNLGDMQQQQQQRLSGQPNNLQNLQQQQQQLMAQQNNLSSMHQQQLGSQSNVSGLQQQTQQQLLGTNAVNSSMQSNQHALHMLQSKVSVQQTQQAASNVLANQGQASHAQQAQQQMMSQMQSQPTQLQQQLGMQQQSNLLQREQRLQTSGQTSSSLLQSQNLMDQQKQLYQAQRVVPETSSTSLDSTAQTANVNGGDWQEEIYQKIRSMREIYLSELSEMYNKISSKLIQHDIPQAAKPEQFEKLKIFKLMLERMMNFLNVSKNTITPAFKEKVVQYEKQIISFMNTNRPRRPMHPMQQPQSTQAQLHDSQMNSQVQSMNLQSTMPMMQQSSVTNLQHNSMSSLPAASTAQLGQLQQSSNLDVGQGNTMGSLPQVVPGSLHNAVSAPQQANVNTLPSQGGVNVMQHNMNSIQSNTTMLQNQHMKQQQEQQILQAQQLKQQMQQRQIQQYMQKQQLIQQQQQQLQPQQQQQLQPQQQQQLQPQQQQQQQQQLKQQMHAQLQTQHIPQLHQMNETNDMKIRQGMGVKPGVYQHLPTSQRPGYAHSQLKPGVQFPSSSPQLPQAASPQMHQNSSPQVEQQSMLASITKTGTPLQSANSPFVVPSPSTPMAPSPMPGETEKPVPGTSSLSNVSNLHQQTTGMQAGAPSLAIGTPGISASPLLLEFTGPDVTLPNPLKSNVTEEPLERLIKAVSSISSKALTVSVSDIGSVVSMIDRIAGSAPGNGSRAAIGEDLVAMTKCRLQAKNFITQDGMIGTKKMRRYTSAVPLNVVSSAGSGNDSFKQLTVSETSDLESTATSSFKRPRLEANHALLEEIRGINQRLIDTVVDISDEDVDQRVVAAAAEGNEGTMIKCSFNAVALSPNLKSQYTSAHMSPIQPLRLLVPTNYPNCSPILLDNLPVEVSKEYEDLSVKAQSRFSSSLRSLSQPMSLEEIARTWDMCARGVILEYSQQSGGGSFSSKYGSWENCMMAA